MRVLLSGKRGILGSAIYSYFKGMQSEVDSLERSFFWGSNIDMLVELLKLYDIVIHAAANTDSELCEVNPLECYKDNTLFTERLAIAAFYSKCRFVYISSTGVYGNAKRFDPYHEYDRAFPTTHHHKSKILGEAAVSKYVRESLIVRAGWIFGGTPESKKNFVARRIEEALSSKENLIYANVDQLGVPTSAFDLTQKLYELIRNHEVGLFNLVNTGTATRYEYVRQIILNAELDVTVVPVSHLHFNRVAKVSNNESAVSYKLIQLGYKELPSWKDSLKTYIKNDLNSWLIEKVNGSC